MTPVRIIADVFFGAFDPGRCALDVSFSTRFNRRFIDSPNYLVSDDDKQIFVMLLFIVVLRGTLEPEWVLRWGYC